MAAGNDLIHRYLPSMSQCLPYRTTDYLLSIILSTCTVSNVWCGNMVSENSEGACDEIMRSSDHKGIAESCLCL